MRAGGRGLTTGRERFSLRRALVVAQVALSLVLLAGALLFVRSLQKLMNVDPGFRAEGVLEVDLNLRRASYPKERLRGIDRELLTRLAARPGVESAAEVGFTPVSGSGWDEMVRPETPNAPWRDSNFNRVGPGYFRTMGTPFLAGRDFDDRDTVDATKVAIVNEAFVKKVFGGGDGVGHTFRVEGPQGKPDDVYLVAGVVRDTKYYEIRESFVPIAFLPAAQDDDPGPGFNFVLHTNAAMGPLLRDLSKTVADVHPSIGVQYRALSAQLKESLMRDRLMAALAGSFGLLAGLLATMGLYGVISYMVARRRNEIGIRMALGANRWQVVRLVMREAALLLAIGLAVGLGLALCTGQAAASMLYGLKPRDPATLAGALGLLAAVAMLASFGPARRAARLEPTESLREE
jgi:predicted permease